jgi:predicted enzyme related to lactoylglutathione lyase
MARVTGIGGVFLKARDPKALCAWYREHLGIDVQEWGGTAFPWSAGADPERPGVTVWSVFPESSTYFAPSTARFMVNYRVENLAVLLDLLRAEGCLVEGRSEQSEYGKFGWVIDPEGNKIELWEPPRGPLPG